MIKNVRVLNAFGVDETITFSDISDGIKIKDITGLGPVVAEFVTSKKANGDGVNYNSRNIGSRNIVFSLELADITAKTVEELRWDIYGYFPIGEVVDLRFENEAGAIRQIYGHVESVVPEIFAKEPSMQVSVMCEYPHFYDYPGTNIVTIPDSGIGADVEYLGRVNTGINFEILVTGATSGSMGNVNLLEVTPGLPDRGFRIDDFDLVGITSEKLGSGDKINICTVPGKKKATFTKSTGEVYNIMGAVKNSGYYLTEDQWPMLFRSKISNFVLGASVYPLSSLQVTVSWDTLIEGL